MPASPAVPRSFTIWSIRTPDGGFSGIGPFYGEEAEAEFTRRLVREGNAVLGHQTSWRNCSPTSVGDVAHDDARWAESRFTEGSMAAYGENGGRYAEGRWWETASGLAKMAALR